MKAGPFPLLVILALAAASSTLAQYSARTLTRKVVPQPQQPAAARPAPQYAAPAAAAPARSLTAADAARIKADKSKNAVKQFEYFQRRAKEGSDHAMYELAVRYLTGKGTDPDEKLGREWLAKSAKKGYRKATKLLSELPPYKPEPPEAGKLAKSEVPAAAAPKTVKAAAKPAAESAVQPAAKPQAK